MKQPRRNNVTLLDRLKIFQEIGWEYNPITGEIKSHTKKKPTGITNGYIMCSFWHKNLKKVITVSAHQLGWYLYYKEVPNLLDHINRIKTDNKIDNLREISRSLNAINTNKNDNANGYIYNKEIGKFISRIRINNKQIYLGSYDSKELANEAYIKYKREIYETTKTQ